MRLLAKVRGTRRQFDESVLINSAGQFLKSRLHDLDDYSSVTEFAKEFPTVFDEDQMSTLRSEFQEYCEEFDASRAHSPDDLRESAGMMGQVGAGLGVDVEGIVEGLITYAKEWDENSPPEPDPDEDREFDLPDGRTESESIDDMFERLRAELDVSKYEFSKPILPTASWVTS